ncbi:hypothetical protein ILYODFUR_024934 [Ilyodon furcidens]|uniref:Uncharacterized protein n=1 Tax=Ilyodon furcidens TaxID=33524 RepID=A0ABV0VGY3_9TELE
MEHDGEKTTKASQEESEETSQELPKEELLVQIVTEEDTEETPTTKPEDEPLILIPVEPQSEETDHLGPDGEEPTPEEAGQEKIVYIVPGDSAEQVLHSKDEETLSISSSEEVETSQEHPKEETLNPVVTEDNTEETSTSKPEEEPLIFVPVEPETEETELLGPKGEDATPHKSSQNISTEQESVIETQEAIPVSGSETPEELAKEEDHDVNEKILEGTTDKEENIVLPPAEPETETEETPPEESSQADPWSIAPLDSSETENRGMLPGTQEKEDSYLLVPSDGEGASEMATDFLIVLVGYANEKCAPEDSNLKRPVEHEDSTAAENHPEDGNKAAEMIPAAVEGHKNICIQTDSKASFKGPFKASGSSVYDEPAAPLNRGAILGAALFTLMSFIITGFVVMTISKKLR